jgi:hypothetical protein
MIIFHDYHNKIVSRYHDKPSLFGGRFKKSLEIYDNNIEELFDIVEEVDKSKQHMVFIQLVILVYNL